MAITHEQQKQANPRRSYIVEARKADASRTLASIAEPLGISRERVRQILQDEGLRSASFRAHGHCDKCGGHFSPTHKYKAKRCGACIPAHGLTDKVTKPCNTCGKPVERHPSESNQDNPHYTNNVVYCDMKCFRLGPTIGRRSLNR